MQEMFREAILRFALPGFVAAVVAFLVGGAFLRLWAQCRALNACHWALAASILFVAFTVGGTKTNGVNNLPPQQMTLPQPILQPLGLLPRPGAPVPLANPGQGRFAQNIAADWNICGAWKDSFWLPFTDGWTFPWGTNHLSGVEVVSYGRLWPTPFNTNAVASAGAPFEIVPGLTSFAYELTLSNSYRFVWTDAAIGRDTNNLVTAELELFRSGDRSVATNGVATYLPRELPFPHDGFGQDAEWVAANFTNATEILSVGYPQWVDAQIGHGLENGFFKYTATFTETPPETVQLVVGDCSVAVTNAGAYVFLLEKGMEYEYGTLPFVTNVMYSASDDIPLQGLRSLSITPGEEVRTWTVDGGYDNMAQTGVGLGRMWWMPTLCGSPDVSHIGLADNPMTFAAILTDCRNTNNVSFSWSAGGGLFVASPNAQMTEVCIDEMPSWAAATLSVSATLGNHTLNSQLDGLTYGTNDTPQVHIALNIPNALLLNSNEVDAAKIAAVGWSFDSDVPTSGVLRVSCAAGSGKVVALGLSGEWQVQGGESLSSATLEGIATSDVVGDVVFAAEFIGAGGTSSVTRALTVVRTDGVVIPSAPEDGLVVLTNTPVAMHLGCAPSGAGSLLSTMWHVRRLKSDGTFGEWSLVEYIHPGSSTVFTPVVGGIYEVRAFASVPAGGADERFYVWNDGELVDPFGLKTSGDRKMLGVADCQWQINLRNHALAYIGSSLYSRSSIVPSQYDFSSIPEGLWKCNMFVAHSIMRAGLQVPHNSRFLSTYPPVANDWANGTGITGWLFLGRSVYVQPGYVVGHPASIGSGHCGIMDFDGSAIAAGRHSVNRQDPCWLDGTSGFHKYGTQNE